MIKNIKSKLINFLIQKLDTITVKDIIDISVQKLIKSDKDGVTPDIALKMLDGITTSASNDVSVGMVSKAKSLLKIQKNII